MRLTSRPPRFCHSRQLFGNQQINNINCSIANVVFVKRRKPLTVLYLSVGLFTRNMNFDLLQGFREILHGLGEKRPRVDSVKLIHSIVVKQMVLLIYKTLQVSREFNHQKILMKHVIYVLRNHKYTIVRILTYFLLKENIHKISIASKVEENEVNGSNEQSTPTVDKDFVDAVLNFDKNNEIMNLNPINIFTSTSNNLKGISISNYANKSVYKNVVNAIISLKLNLNVTNEDLRIATEARKLRVNDLSIVLSPNRYEDFQQCRRKNFHNTKIGTALLEQVNKALPSNIYYTKDVKEIFMFLAKETIACLFDRVHENRKCNTCSIPPGIEQTIDENHEAKEKFESICINEITVITSSAWNQSLEDVQIPFKINNTFLTNQLIFD